MDIYKIDENSIIEKENKMLIEKYSLNMYENIQVNDIFFSIGKNSNKRFIVVDIDENYYYIEKDKIDFSNKRIRILFDTCIFILREGQTAYENAEVNTMFNLIDNTGLFDKYLLSITKDELEKYNDSNKEEKRKYKKNILDKILSYNIFDVNEYRKGEEEIFNSIIGNFKENINDKNDNIFLLELWNKTFDILITEDKKIHQKASRLGLENRVFNITEFIDELNRFNTKTKCFLAESILELERIKLKNINYKDKFFDDFRKDYSDFNHWFGKKLDKEAYIIKQNNEIKTFLFLQIENINDVDRQIKIPGQYDRVLKISSLKSTLKNISIGERLLYLAIKTALNNNLKIIYVTFYDNQNEEKNKLKRLLIDWGFNKSGVNSNGEIVYIKEIDKYIIDKSPSYNYPLTKENKKYWILPIEYQYHSHLIPDLKTKRDNINLLISNDYDRNKYKIKKYYLSNTAWKNNILNNISKGDILLTYRKGLEGTVKNYTSAITGELIVNNILIKEKQDITDEEYSKYTIFNKNTLTNSLGINNKVVIIEFIYYNKYKNPVIRDILIRENIINGKERILLGESGLSRENYEKIKKYSEIKNFTTD